MSKFKGRYRIESTRFPDWDYRTAGFYFVTICTKRQQLFLGSIVDEKICLSSIGKIVSYEWREIQKHHRGIVLDHWIVMPDHLHGIIVIQENDQVKNNQKIQSPSLGVVVNQFKGRCTRRIHATGHRDFSWQRGYYDQIIRNETMLAYVRQYIESNPAKWQLDKDIAENIDTHL